jgi:cytoskeleton protein RodZ
MSDAPGEAQGESPAGPAQATAGSLLRDARLAKGLHIAALATSIKVAPRKLELLEADRFDELPGATFTRALAQTICRTLKIDPAPVLALLPQPADQGLSHMSLGLNAPFRDKPGHRVPSDLQFLKSPVVLGAAVLLLASVLLYLLPAGWVGELTQGMSAPGTTTESAGAPAGQAASAPAAFPSILPASAAEPSSPASGMTSEIVAPAVLAPAAPASAEMSAASAAVPAVAASAASAPAVAVAGALSLRATAPSWIEVVDGRGRTLMSRHLEPGETVGLDGPSPLRVRIGNAAATQVSYKGKPVELAPSRDNVAKLELR